MKIYTDLLLQLFNKYKKSEGPMFRFFISDIYLPVITTETIINKGDYSWLMQLKQSMKTKKKF